MASQTETEVQVEIKDRIAILQEIRKFGSVNSSGSLSNYISREESAYTDRDGDYTINSNVAMRTQRSLIASALDSGLARQILDPLLLNYAKVVGNIVETSGPGILQRLYLRFIANSLSVKSRGITYSAVSAGSNLGSGTINRLTVDAYGFNLEACHMEAKRAECVQDETTGAEQAEEIFRVRGATREIDQLRITGSGLLQDVRALSSRNSIVTNASFSQFDGTITVLTGLSGWIPGSGATTFTNLNLDQTNYYRASGGTGDPTPASLKFLGSEYVYQALETNGVKLDPGIPIYAQLAYNASVGTAVGTLIFTMGNVSVSVVVTGASGWNLLRIPLNKMLYPRNFANLTDPVIKVQFIRTSGTLLVDDLVIGPMANLDGTWLQIVGGATAFISGNRDSFTWTDALTGTDSIIQQWLWRTYGLHLPYKTDGSETWTDPSV